MLVIELIHLLYSCFWTSPYAPRSVLGVHDPKTIIKSWFLPWIGLLCRNTGRREAFVCIGNRRHHSLEDRTSTKTRVKTVKEGERGRERTAGVAAVHWDSRAWHSFARTREPLKGLDMEIHLCGCGEDKGGRKYCPECGLHSSVVAFLESPTREVRARPAWGGPTSVSQRCKQQAAGTHVQSHMQSNKILKFVLLYHSVKQSMAVEEGISWEKSCLCLKLL